VLCYLLQGYAYILTHPGQPCVFYDHVYEWGEGLRDAILNMVRTLKPYKNLELLPPVVPWQLGHQLHFLLKFSKSIFLKEQFFVKKHRESFRISYFSTLNLRN
jgi:hypothetical protein